MSRLFSSILLEKIRCTFYCSSFLNHLVRWRKTNQELFTWFLLLLPSLPQNPKPFLLTTCKTIRTKFIKICSFTSIAPKPTPHTGLLLPPPDGMRSTQMWVPVTTRTGWGPPPQTSQFTAKRSRDNKTLTAVDNLCCISKASSEGYFPHALNLQTLFPTPLAKKKVFQFEILHSL